MTPTLSRYSNPCSCATSLATSGPPSMCTAHWFVYAAAGPARITSATAASPKILCEHMIALPFDSDCYHRLWLQFHTSHYYPPLSTKTATATGFASETKPRTRRTTDTRAQRITKKHPRPTTRERNGRIERIGGRNVRTDNKRRRRYTWLTPADRLPPTEPLTARVTR